MKKKEHSVEEIILDNVKEVHVEVDITIDTVKSSLNQVDEIKLSLTKDQEMIVVLYYDEARSAVADIVSSSLPTPVKVTKMIAVLMKLMERIRHNDRPLKGSDKKTIVMELIHRILMDLVPDRDILTDILTSFHNTAEHVLETLVDISKNLHVAEEIATGCCMMLLSK